MVNYELLGSASEAAFACALAGTQVSGFRSSRLNFRIQDLRFMLIPMKVVSDSDLIPVAGSEVKPGIFGAQRRWLSYGA